MKSILLTFLFLSIVLLPSLAQLSFTKINQPTNDISNHPAISAYTGASWIDYNGDGHIDLFVNSNFLYRNDSNGVFTINNNIGINTANGLGNGNSWGDFDNDGDPDLARTHSLSDILENKDSLFFNQTSGRLESLVYRGWSTAWGDYDNDGFLDLVMVHPQGFLGAAQKNILYHNDGDGRFTRIFNDVTADFSAYTGCTWTDFDLDGDLDLFIGSGEVSNLSEDDIFINKLSETGTADLIRLDTGILATDLRDGQNWNWIDFDNDGDLDGFVTNYNASKSNDFYKNDGNGVYRLLSSIEVGNIVNQLGAGLTNLWGDFDNDGDLDCFVTFDGGQQDRFYKNDSSFFNEVTLSLSATGSSRGASAGDYDNDGFLDLFVSSASASSVGLYKNDGNSNNWIILDLEGSISNKSAIGAMVRLKATIGGQAVWQMREVNSQNSFCGANDLRVHFGLRDAPQADSIIINWPSGQIDVLVNTSPNSIYTITESIPSGYLRANFSADNLIGEDSLNVKFSNLSLNDPLDTIVSYQWDFDSDGVIDAIDREPEHLFQYSPNPYSIKLIVSNGAGSSDTLIRQDYITINNDISSFEKWPISDNSNFVFPNPIKNSFRVKGIENLESIEITDLGGRTIIKLDALKNNSVFKIPSIPNGFYIFKLDSEKALIVQKVIIQD
ncbi:MAG: FG-GAP-like repeat-containing protein [Cytophagales bacterium]